MKHCEAAGESATLDHDFGLTTLSGFEGFTMGLRVAVSTLHAGSQGLSFQCNNGREQIACVISAETLRDLIGFQGLNQMDEGAFRLLLPQIERIVSAKYEVGRIEENGALSICTADILRYGRGTGRPPN